MKPAGTGNKRPYLPSKVRHHALLDVAAGIVGRGGWNALTMKGLALAAGVSRQLVYDHFEDADRLFSSVMRHLFERSFEATSRVLREPADDAQGTVRAAYQIFLDMPPAERRALRAISNEFGPDRPEVREVKKNLRSQILGLWVPYARRQMGLDENDALPIVWMLIAAAWGLSELVEDGTVSETKAQELLAAFVERVMAPTAARPDGAARGSSQSRAIPRAETRGKGARNEAGQRRDCHERRERRDHRDEPKPPST